MGTQSLRGQGDCLTPPRVFAPWASYRRLVSLARMDISPSSSGSQADEVRQATLLKKAIKAEQAQTLALVESANPKTPGQPLDTRSVGRLLNEKA